MEKLMEGNRAHLTGRVISEPAFNHKTYGEAFYMMVLGVLRKSGHEDSIKLIISERIMGSTAPKLGDFIDIHGQIRTYNRESEGRNHLEITVFVREMEYCIGEYFYHTNEVNIEGFICKAPVKRTSPLGREICDLMVAVNRLYNKSDYIPSIAWGRNAVYADTLKVGDKVLVEGRLQSREYRKYTDEGEAVIKMAYEVSVGRIEVV